jgi:hypothetical protein
MNLDEFIRRMNQLKSEIEKQAGPIMERTAISAKGLIERRIIEKGIGKYSEKKSAPAFYFYGKGNDKTKEANFIKEKSKRVNKKPQYTNWKEFRESQGLQTNHVDLSFSRRMWNNVKVTNLTKQGLRFIATLSNDQPEEEKKMEWNTDRYGEFLKTNDQEEQILANALNGELQRAIDRIIK